MARYAVPILQRHTHRIAIRPASLSSRGYGRRLERIDEAATRVHPARPS
ncbi:hypothetical protein C7S15_6148 [Burkholderia cepacia]|nr:hypothetical protein [Burkholderia cepacia]